MAKRMSAAIVACILVSHAMSAHVSKTSGCRVVWLQMGSQTRGQGGAALAHVWRGDLPRSFDDEETIRDRMFDAQLLLRGYAQAATVYPDTRCSEAFVKSQGGAREKGRGLWR